ncbi:MAG: 50S ribosomal protein L9 [Oscillospiraceae bacterium]
MKVILTQDVKSQGKKGQLIEVSEGYGRNYLLPRKLATEATADNMNKMKLQDKARLAREAAEKAEAEAVGTQLEGLLVKVSGKAGTGGRLFGSITTKEIADALKEQFQIDIPKTKLVQDDPIKAFGTYQIKCKLGYEVTGTVNVLVTEEK